MLAPFLQRALLSFPLYPHVHVSLLRYPSRSVIRASPIALTRMPVTRSTSTRSTRASTKAKVAEDPLSDIDSGAESEVAPKKKNGTGTKRKAAASNGRKAPAKKAKAAPEPEELPEDYELPPPSVPANDPSRGLVPAKLTFSFEDAKKHLISVDSRFEILFTRLKCRPYEHLQQFDPFSTLASSILGQQISWKAARSIQHRFIRLFNPGLPESPNFPYDKDAYFPTAKQVAGEDLATLKSAGLSERKAQYIQDLAQRFADGRLTTEKLLNADDEELYELLIEVRGIGKWTVDMFAIFSLRRPDILPVGDLGVQRGVARWFLALHSPTFNISISPDKLPVCPDDEEALLAQASGKTATAPAVHITTSVNGTPPASSAVPNDASAIPPVAPIPSTPKPGGKDKDNDGVPPPVTPSVNKTLSRAIDTPNGKAKPLPEGLTPSQLKARLNGKQRKAPLLTEREMEAFTAPWKPYRSLAVYYMWALAEDTTSD